MCSQFAILCIANRADSLCSAGRCAAAVVLYFDFVTASTALFPVLICIMLLYIVVRSFFTRFKSLGTHRAADRAALVVDSRGSASRGRFQILFIYNFLIFMRSQFAILCIANRANSLCSAGCRTAAVVLYLDFVAASTALFPVLLGVMLLYIVVRSFFTILKRLGTRYAADGAALVIDGRRSASRGRFQILFIYNFLILMAGGFCDDRIFIHDLGRAVGIREPLIAGRADPIRRIAVFRAGRVLCVNGSQRVADRDLRRSDDRCNIFKIRKGCTLPEEFIENRNVLRLCVTFQDLKCQCK